MIIIRPEGLTFLVNHKFICVIVQNAKRYEPKIVFKNVVNAFYSLRFVDFSNEAQVTVFCDYKQL